MPLSPTSYHLHRITLSAGSVALVGTAITAPFSRGMKNTCLDATVACVALDFAHSVLERCGASTPEEKQLTNRNLKMATKVMFFYGAAWLFNQAYEHVVDTALGFRDVRQ